MLRLCLFLGIGGLQFALDSGLFIALTWAGVAPVIANIFARLMAACVGFALNGTFTFGQRALTKVQFIRYLICWVILTIASTTLVASAEATAGLDWAWVTKILVEIVLAAVSFVLMRSWVFRARLG